MEIRNNILPQHTHLTNKKDVPLPDPPFDNLYLQPPTSNRQPTNKKIIRQNNLLIIFLFIYSNNLFYEFILTKNIQNYV
jgi:hypothetical protein